MVRKEDTDRLRALLKETITLLCRNGLDFESEFCIEALIGITLDHKDVLLVSINETIKSELHKTKGNGNTPEIEIVDPLKIRQKSPGRKSSEDHGSWSQQRNARKRKLSTEEDGSRAAKVSNQKDKEPGLDFNVSLTLGDGDCDIWDEKAKVGSESEQSRDSQFSEIKNVRSVSQNDSQESNDPEGGDGVDEEDNDEPVDIKNVMIKSEPNDEYDDNLEMTCYDDDPQASGSHGMGNSPGIHDDQSGMWHPDQQGMIPAAMGAPPNLDGTQTSKIIAGAIASAVYQNAHLWDTTEDGQLEVKPITLLLPGPLAEEGSPHRVLTAASRQPTSYRGHRQGHDAEVYTKTSGASGDILCEKYSEKNAFVCPRCMFPYVHKGNLLRHMMKMHNVPQEEASRISDEIANRIMGSEPTSD